MVVQQGIQQGSDGIRFNAEGTVGSDVEVRPRDRSWWNGLDVSGGCVSYQRARGPWQVLLSAGNRRLSKLVLVADSYVVERLSYLSTPFREQVLGS